MVDDQKIDVKDSAKILGQLLFLGAYKDSESIFEKTKKFREQPTEESKLGEMFGEMLYFYLHLTDRFAFEYLVEKKDGFLDDILVQVFSIHLDAYKSAGGRVSDETFYRIFNETYKKRQAEYGKYRLVLKDGEGFKGYLFWEFEKRLVELLGNKDDVALIAFIQVALMPLVERHHELCKEFIGEIA